MSLYEFLLKGDFYDSDRVVIGLESPDHLPDWLHGYKGSVRKVPYEFLRCPVVTHDVKDHYIDEKGVEYVSLCFITIQYRYPASCRI